MFAQRFLPWLGQCGTVLKNDRHVIGYASGNFGKAILLGSVDVTLLFLLTDIIGIAPGIVSRLMMLVFAGDLVFDLVAGAIAGKAERHGIGYRRLIAVCAPLCAVAFCAIYSLTVFQVSELAIVGGLILCLRFTYALIDVPHNSLLARVTADSHARGRVSGYRTIFSSAASVSVACVIAPLMHGAGGEGSSVRLAWLGAVGGGLFLGTLLLAAWASKPVNAPPMSSRSRRDAQMASRNHAGVQVAPQLPSAKRVPTRAERGGASALPPAPDGLAAAMAGIAVVTGFAAPMFAKTLLYLCTYVLKSPGFAGEVLLILALSQIAGATCWIALVRRWDKSTLLAMSHAVAAAGLALFAAAGENRAALVVCTAVMGVGFAGVFMLPWGILADVIDFSEFRHRKRRETIAFALMLVLLKAGGAAALATVGAVLGALGYVPGAVQPEAVLLGMKTLAFGVPIAGSVIAILILQRLRIGHVLHARVSRVNLMRRARLQAAA